MCWCLSIIAYFSITLTTEQRFMLRTVFILTVYVIFTECFMSVGLIFIKYTQFWSDLY